MSKNFETIELNVRDKIGELVLDRPRQLNALNKKLRDEIRSGFSQLGRTEIEVLVIKGRGKAFCAGADVQEFLQFKPHQFIDEMEDFFFLPERFSRPVVAAIDGYALGGGLELALACDLRLATSNSVFGQPEINLGLIPGGGGTQRLTRSIGMGRAKEMVMTGRQIEAETAEEWGLINKSYPKADFEEKVEELTQKLSRGPTEALKVAKKVINEGADIPLPQAIQLEQQAFSLLLETDDAREGIEAFLDKREAEFD